MLWTHDPATFAVVSHLLFFAVGLALAVLFLTGWTVHRLTRPPRRTFAVALAQGRPGEPAQLAPGPHGPRAWNETILAWQGPSLPVWEITGDDPAGPVIILTHGWGDSRIGGLSRVGAFAPLASRLILWDMPGHGAAPGTCTLGTSEPVALRRLIESVQLDQHIVLMGWSLGAGVSIAAMASWHGHHSARVVGVIAEAPYRFPWTPARNVLEHFGMPHRANLPLAMALLGIDFGVGPGWLGKGGFDRAKLAAKLHCPLLVLHGARDEICPLADGETIAANAARGECVVVAGAGHHGLWTVPEHAEQCERAARGFVREARAHAAPTVRAGVRTIDA